MGDVRSGSNYYDKWSKYTETQLCAMDEEDKAEREAFEARRKAAAQEEEGVDDGGTGLTKAAAAMATMTPAERLWQARREKEKGNEMFKAREYPNAINAYSLSLKLSPGVAAVHTNRAAAYLKVKRCESCHSPKPTSVSSPRRCNQSGARRLGGSGSHFDWLVSPKPADQAVTDWNPTPSCGIVRRAA